MTNPGAPRSSSDGLIYIPLWSMVTELKIAPGGALSVLRNITVDAVKWGIIFVAVGPQTGQLCILRRSFNYMTIYIVSLSNDAIANIRFFIPGQTNPISTSSALHTGQVLITMVDVDFAECVLVLYQEGHLSDLTNFTHESCSSIAYKDHFLIVDYLRADILVLDGQGRLVHTTDYGNGYIAGVRDLAVWQDSVFVVDFEGALLLLSPV